MNLNAMATIMDPETTAADKKARIRSRGQRGKAADQSATTTTGGAGGGRGSVDPRL
jgi:hypothetical protein